METKSISVERALWTGTAAVNLPVFVILTTPLWLRFLNPKFEVLDFAFPLFFVAAWFWWSVTVPKWRLWAYKRVDHVQELKRQAVTFGLTWPSGSFFERTEIKTSAHRQAEKRLERQKP